MTASVWTRNNKKLLAEVRLICKDRHICGEAVLIASGVATHATVNGHIIEFRPIACTRGQTFSMELLDVKGMDDLYPVAGYEP